MGLDYCLPLNVVNSNQKYWFNESFSKFAYNFCPKRKRRKFNHTLIYKV